MWGQFSRLLHCALSFFPELYHLAFDKLNSSQVVSTTLKWGVDKQQGQHGLSVWNLVLVVLEHVVGFASVGKKYKTNN